MSAAQSQEIAERTGAGLRWLEAAFKRANKKDDGANALVIQVQADVWDLDGPVSRVGLKVNNVMRNYI